LTDITDDEYDQLQKLALRGGAFKTHLRLSQRDKEEYKGEKIFLMKHNRSKKLVGWSLCFKPQGIYLFVATKFRRKGYGKELYSRAFSYFNRRHKKPTIFRHDMRSNRFYDKVSDDSKIRIA